MCLSENITHCGCEAELRAILDRKIINYTLYKKIKIGINLHNIANKFKNMAIYNLLHEKV